jgi:hypothetical protein
MSVQSGQPSYDDSLQALNRAIWDSNEVLVTASTTSKLHRATLTLNRAKLFAIKHTGLGMIDDMSVRIEDVLNVNGSIGPISGIITITTRFTKPGAPYTIGPFHRKDTLRLKRIIQGYVIALERKINLNMVPTNELITGLYELGEDDSSIRG